MSALEISTTKASASRRWTPSRASSHVLTLSASGAALFSPGARGSFFIPPPPNPAHARLARGPLDDLVPGHLEAAADHGSSLPGIDDVVDQRVPGGDVGIDVLLELRDERLARLGGVLGGLDLLAEDDVHGALGTHERD